MISSASPEAERAPEIEDVVCIFLAREISGLAINRNLFAGPVEAPKKGAIPEEGVWVQAFGGTAPEFNCGVTGGGWSLSPRVQVRVRAPRNNYKAGRDLSRLVMRKLLMFPILEWAGIRELMPIQSLPAHLGKDATGLDEWSQNFTGWVDHLQETV